MHTQYDFIGRHPDLAATREGARKAAIGLGTSEEEAAALAARVQPDADDGGFSVPGTAITMSEDMSAYAQGRPTVLCIRNPSPCGDSRGGRAATLEDIRAEVALLP